MTLLLFLRTPTFNGSIPVEIDLDGTIADLYAIPEIAGTDYIISHGGVALTDMTMSLADSSLSMQSCIDADRHVSIKTLIRGTCIAHALCDDGTYINSSGCKRNDVIHIGSATTIITKVNLHDKYKFLNRYDIKEFLVSYIPYSYYLIEKSNNSLYLINNDGRFCLHDLVMPNINHIAREHSRLFAWNDRMLYRIRKKVAIRKNLCIDNIKDVSIDRCGVKKYGDVAVLTSKNIIFINSDYNIINRCINVSNVVQISLKCNILGCMTTDGTITIYNDDDSICIGKAQGFVLTRGYMYFKCVDVALIKS
jgi:hypothetical protein